MKIEIHVSMDEVKDIVAAVINRAHNTKLTKDDIDVIYEHNGYGEYSAVGFKTKLEIN